MRDFCAYRGFSGMGHRMLPIAFSPTDPRCYANEIWDKIGYNSACVKEACRLDMKFNANKSQIIRIGQMRRTHTCYISIGGSSVQFVHELKYLFI